MTDFAEVKRSLALQYGTLCYVLYSHASRQLNQVCAPYPVIHYSSFEQLSSHVKGMSA